MKLTSITAAVLAASLSTAALAQTADVGVGAKVGAKADVAAGAAGNDVAANANASAGAKSDMKMNVGQIVSSFRNGSEVSTEWAAELQGLSPDAEVNIVKLSELKGSAAENSAALDQVIADAQADLTTALPTIEANAELKAALEAQSFAADDVVAVMVDGDSQVTLIVDDAS
jgi:hypothetical protein